ncbi:S-layer homology domain-containing protein [Paenibacillus cellulositrophicus]|uniref:immunoglobulin-like domain-containing protein n=1 Tax=Paenibacillus cellulositrophicus TaxID=562959 RepID=UPI00203BA557|nr:immunoglobulin-like domain-containing protein [Paenibacillus cellulositrophicus]MCM3000731.1 S-layer homology domain-containing protein [Paenibacillus cellulositrophicus]
MSNTSYPFKENSNVMNVQGGEKKVMKKILTVALSTAMAFSMFASVAFGDTAVTPQQKFDALAAKGIFNGYPDGSAHLEKEMTRAEFAKVITKLLGLKEVTGTLSYKDKGYDAKNWAVPYIEAVTAAGIMQGQDSVKKIFNYNGKVTIQEMATVLTRALKLEVPANPSNNAADWAKGYVQAAIDKGLISKDANFKANASRSQLVEAAYAIDQAANITFTYKVVDPSNVEFTLSTGEVVKVKLDKPLEANKETEVKFKDAAGNEYTAKVTWAVTTATKVQGASATNLKEVVVKFDGEVDKDSAENAANYTLRSGKLVDSVSLSDDKTTATLLLKAGSVLNNNKTDAVSVSNVKAGDKTISASNVEFSVVDNSLPEVSSVKSLGTKSLKVVFSEPVSNVTQSNFTLDGKEFFGKVTVSNNDRTVVLTPFSSTALTVGDHKVTVSGVKDYAGFVSLASSHDFTVAEDTTAPTISEATATLESVTVTFSEDVDVDTVSASKVYWKSGSSKITAVSVKQLADNKFRFDFGADRALPTGAVSVFVEGVKDYSGNEIAKDTSVVVTPVIDQTRPEVSNVSAENARQIKVSFSKAVNKESAEKTANYTVKDKDGKAVSVKKATRDEKDNKVVYVDLYTDLSVGNNTLTIQNVKDDTRLQNTLLDYTGTVTLADKNAPTIDSSSVNTQQRKVFVKFNKKMDIESLTTYSNYLVEIDNKAVALTSNIADITPQQDGSAVTITFADSINGKIVNLTGGIGGTNYTNISKLTIMGLKDATGNVLKEFTDNAGKNAIDLTKDTVVGLGDKFELVDRKTVKVKFNSGIYSYSSGAFVNEGTNAPQVSGVDVDGTSTVTLHFSKDLKTDGSDLNLKVYLARLTTSAGNVAGSGEVTVTKNTPGFKDSIAPVLADSDAAFPVTGDGNAFAIKFSEPVTALSNDVAVGDFRVYRDTDNTELFATKGEFSVVVDNTDTVVVKVNDTGSRAESATYKVEVNNAKAVVDQANNPIANFVGHSVALTGTAAPSVKFVDSDFGQNNGQITGLNSNVTYEYKKNGEADTKYVEVKGQTSIPNLAPGKYDIRIKAVPAAGTTPAVPASAVTTVTIGEKAANDTDAVTADAAALTADKLTVVGKDTDSPSVKLPATGANGTTISWSVGGVSQKDSLAVERPDTGSTDITLTATVKKGTATPVTKTFTVTVPSGTGDVTVK